MLKVAYIGFGNSVCRYHLPYVEKRKDFIDVKYIYRLETEINEEKESWYPGIKFTSSINEIMDDPDVNLVVVNTQIVIMWSIQCRHWIMVNMFYVKNHLQ